MKQIKIAIFCVLALTGFLFMGELSILNLDSFQSEYYESDFYIDSLSKGTTSREMISDFCKAAKNNDVDFFAVKFTWDKTFSYDTTIIGTQAAIKHLKKAGIKEGDNKSLFFEDQVVSFENIKDAADVSMINTYYFIGDESKYDNICHFKLDLVDKYGGSFPREKGSGAARILMLVTIWGIIFSIVIALSLYEVSYKKKENMIRVILGESLAGILTRNLLCDTISFVVVFLALSIMLKSISNVTFMFSGTLCMFLIFIAINALINLNYLRTNYKKDLASGEGDNGFIATSYVLKVMLLIITIIVLSVNYIMIHEALNIRQQKTFFHDHKNCSYYKMSYGMDNISEESDPDVELYSKLYEKFSNDAYQYVDLSEYYSMKRPLVLLNKNSFREVCQENKRINDISKDIENDKVSLLLPESIKEGSTEYECALETNDGTFLSAGEYGSWNIVRYKEGITVEAVHNNGTKYSMQKYKNPVILLDNTRYDAGDYTTGYDPYYNYDIMYDISKSEWEEFRTDNQIPEAYLSITNVNDEFLHEYMQQNRKLLLAVVFSIFILFLEFSLMILIIRMEYQFNAIEMALMKIHGYSLYERNVRLIKGTIGFGIAGIILALVLSLMLKMIYVVIPVVIIGVGLILCETVFIVCRANSVEKQRVATILKAIW